MSLAAAERYWPDGRGTGCNPRTLSKRYDVRAGGCRSRAEVIAGDDTAVEGFHAHR
jgi:hypothetical protein